MAKDIGVKPKRITHLGCSSSPNTESPVDYIQDIIKDMDSMKNFSHHVHYENVLKSLKKKPVASGSVLPQVPENPPEYNIHGTKLSKTSSNKYHPLMAKCQKNLKYLQHNRTIPKPRAHIKVSLESSLKKPQNQCASRLSSNNTSIHTSEKIKPKKNLEAFKRLFSQPESDIVNQDILLPSKKINQKTPKPCKRILQKPKSDFTNHDRSVHISEKVKQVTTEAFKRSFPKPESDSVKLCQPFKKIIKTNSFQNSSSDSKQSSLLSTKIKVKNKEERKCSSMSSENDILPKSSETSTAQLSETDSDDDFESFVNKHKPKHSSHIKKSHKRNHKSLQFSDEEDKNVKTKCKMKKMHKSKSPKLERTLKITDQQSRKTRSNSHYSLEPKESSSDEQIDELNKLKWKKKKTEKLKLSQCKIATEKLEHREKKKRSDNVIESSESEPEEMYANDICSDTSDCTESTPKEQHKINYEKMISESAELKEPIVHVRKGKELSASNDLISEKNIILGENVTKKSNPKTFINSENVFPLSVHEGKVCSASNDLGSEKKVIPAQNLNNESSQKTSLNSKQVLFLPLHKGKELHASNDLVSEKNITSEVNVNKKSNLKTCMNLENVPSFSSHCSVLTEQNDIDKKSKLLSSKDFKIVAVNEIDILPVSNEILIEISDEEDNASPNESDAVHNINSSESNKQVPNLNFCANVEAQDAQKALAASDSANCTKSERSSEKDDSDVEIVEIDVHKPTFSKYNHNDGLATNSSSISQDKTLETDANVVKQLNENNSIKVSAEQVTTECKAKLLFNEPNTATLKENTEIQDIETKSQNECTSFSVVINSDDDVTILEANSAEHKGNVSKVGEDSKLNDFEDRENAITDNCITLSDEDEDKDLEKMESGELVKSCFKSIGEVCNKENVLSLNGANRTEINSLQRTLPCITTESSLSESVNVSIYGEDDCVILEPMSCVTEKLKDVSIKNENSCIVSQKIRSTEQNGVKLCNINCSSENSMCNSVAKNLISLNHSNKIITVQNQSSQKSEAQNSENDCLILDDAPVQVLSSNSTVCSDKNIQSFIYTNTISEASSTVIKEKAFLMNASVKSERGFTDPQNVYCIPSTPIAVAERQIQCKVENQESSTISYEKLSEQSSNIKIPVVKPCVYPSNVLPEKSQTNNVINCNLNSESSRELRKKLPCNYPPHSALFHDDASSILQGEKDFPGSNNLNKITLDSLNSLKTPEMKGLKHNSSLNELNAIAEARIHELSHMENKSILPLLELYQNEVGYYNNLKQTVKDVDNGIRTALELQAERIKHLAFSIKSIVQNDSRFNSLSEKCDLPIGQKQIKEESLQDKMPYFSAEDLKKSHSTEDDCTSSCSTSTQANEPCFSNAFFEKGFPSVTNRTTEILEQLRQIKVESLQNKEPYSSAEGLKKCHSSKNNLCDTSSLTSSNEPCFSNAFFEKGYRPIEKQIKEASLQNQEPYSLVKDIKKTHSSNSNLCDVSTCSTSSAHCLQDKVPNILTEDLNKSTSSNNNLSDVSSLASSTSGTGSSKTDGFPASNICHEFPLNYDALPQLSLESLHENSSDCVKKFEPLSIKSEPLDENGEDQYFEEETKYSKSSEFQAIQPEAMQELRNSKCSVCNKPAVGACYFCCSVFYCSVQCSESVLGKYHRELCSEEYNKKR